MYSIQVISAESGIKPETLRKWEQRYGFPAPARAPNGYRSYSELDLQRLLKARELLDQGYQPSKIFKDNLLFEQKDERDFNYEASKQVKQIYELAKSHQGEQAFALMKDYRTSLGTLSFVEEICVPLVELMGSGWQAGDLSVFNEHLLSEYIHALLPIGQRSAYPETAPVAILATLSNELHTLGLKLANAVLNDVGCKTHYLGGNLPVSEIIEASYAYQADYVCLSVSTKTSPKVITEQVLRLAEAVAPQTDILIGGHGSSYITELPANVKVITQLSKLSQITLIRKSTGSSQ